MSIILRVFKTQKYFEELPNFKLVKYREAYFNESRNAYRIYYII